ncbi:hypothetical protein J3F83DRAFT_107018 [Trichoderma novae-zelandiae]
MLSSMRRARQRLVSVKKRSRGRASVDARRGCVWTGLLSCSLGDACGKSRLVVYRFSCSLSSPPSSSRASCPSRLARSLSLCAACLSPTSGWSAVATRRKVSVAASGFYREAPSRGGTRMQMQMQKREMQMGILAAWIKWPRDQPSSAAAEIVKQIKKKKKKKKRCRQVKVGKGREKERRGGHLRVAMVDRASSQALVLSQSSSSFFFQQFIDRR